MLRLFDGVGGVADRAVDVRDGMAGDAGDAGLRVGMLYVVEVGVVEGAAEERHRVVAAGTPARGVDVAVALLGHRPRFAAR